MGGSDVEASAVGCKSEVMGIVQRQGFFHLLADGSSNAMGPSTDRILDFLYLVSP
jgi:hypothetical protein